MKAAHFSSQELAKVLSHYDIGVISGAAPVLAGNARAPKLVLHSQRGTFLLKRRPHGKEDIRRVAFAHDVQKFLAKAGFTVAALVATTDEQSTILCLDRHVYELFEFISGSRYNGSARATHDAGIQLARFHALLLSFTPHFKPLDSNYHDNPVVAVHFEMAAKMIKPKPNQDISRLLHKLAAIYASHVEHANAIGLSNSAHRIIHGDWHPGNMLFSEDKVVAVVDFDSLKIAPFEIDLANALLQFSIVGSRPNPADWPAYLDEEKFTTFLAGCRSYEQSPRFDPAPVCDLMIEALICEAIAPVAATGTFGSVGGFEFLKMIYNKCRWIEKHREKLDAILNG